MWKHENDRNVDHKGKTKENELSDLACRHDQAEFIAEVTDGYCLLQLISH